MTAEQVIALIQQNLNTPGATPCSASELLQFAESAEWSVPPDKTVLLYSGKAFEGSSPPGQLLGGEPHTYQIA